MHATSKPSHQRRVNGMTMTAAMTPPKANQAPSSIVASRLSWMIGNATLAIVVVC